MTEEEPPVQQGALLRWGSWFYLALAVGGILWLGIRGGKIPLALFFDTRSWAADLAVGVGVAASLVGLWHVARLALPSARTLEAAMAKVVGPLSGAEVAALAGLSGFSEELFFRGALQSTWGIVPATLVFALLHLGPGKQYRLWTVFALVAGAGLGMLMVWRGNLLAPVVAHVVVNLCGLARIARIARIAQAGRPKSEVARG